MTKLLHHIKHNAVAYVALFVALGGSSYAAINLPAGSVGTKQLRNGAVTNRKLAKGSVGAASLDHKSIGGYVRAYAQIRSGLLVSSHPQATLVAWHTEGIAPGGIIRWKQKFRGSCFALATSFSLPTPSYASADLEGGATDLSPSNAVRVVLSDSQALTVNVAIVCPRP